MVSSFFWDQKKRQSDFILYMNFLSLFYHFFILYMDSTDLEKEGHEEE